jgi:hypothetical protein
LTGHPDRSADNDGGVFRRYRVEILLLLAVAVAAVVFGLRATNRAKAYAFDTSRISAESAAGEVREPDDTPTDPAIKVPSKGKSPRRPLFTALPFTSEERDRELKKCIAQARNAVTWPGGGTGQASLVNTGIVGDSLAFVGVAVNLTSGRAIVWRCAIGNWDGRVGGTRFTALESIDGIDLEWSKVAAIDDDVLRRCVVKAHALFPGRRIPPYPSGIRRSDDFILDGVALGSDNGVIGQWQCHVRLRKGGVVSLEVQESAPQQPAPQQSAPQQPAPPQ